MASLTPYLQDGFERLSPKGWSCRREAAFLTPDLERRLGYRPRADNRYVGGTMFGGSETSQFVANARSQVHATFLYTKERWPKEGCPSSAGEACLRTSRTVQVVAR